MREMLDILSEMTAKPLLYERGEAKFWDDPHISRSMLAAHLNSKHDLASRKPETIDKTVRHLFTSQVLAPGMRILDLGCGPGLYSERICRAGTHVVGLDISERSLAYARASAARAGLDIEYRCMNFFDLDFNEEFDAVLQIYGELNTFSDELRDRLLRLVHRALKKDGVFVFDVSTRALRAKHGLTNRWAVNEGGFWRPGRHLVLEQGYDYPAADVWLDQYIIADDSGIKVYRNWFHDYSLATIDPVLRKAGFQTKHVWNDLTGSSFTAGGDWIAIAAVKGAGGTQ
jgi:SAM-dependent methyltransferase